MDKKLNLEHFIQKDNWTLDDELNTSVYESEYLIKKHELKIKENVKTTGKIVEVNFSNFNEETLVLDAENVYLSTFEEALQQEDNLLDPRIEFPLFKNLNVFLNVLEYICTNVNDASRIKFVQHDNVLEYVQALEFFGYYHFDKELKIYEPTSSFSEFIEQANITEKYFHLIKQLGENKTIRDVLLLQLRVREYDAITKSIIREKLAADPNINNKKSNYDLNLISANIRSWYMSIYMHVLKAGNIQK